MGAALRLVSDDYREPVDTPPDVDLLDSWRAYMAAAGNAAGTADTRVRSMQSLMGFSGVDDPLKLTRTHVIAWLGRPIKPWTRTSYYRAVRVWAVWLVEFGHADHCGLLDGIPQPKEPQPVARPINDDTITRLLALKLTSRPHAYVRLALYQALRVHEIAKIRGEDFDMDAG